MTSGGEPGRLRYIPALDGIRGLLLPGVVLLHYSLFLYGRPGAPQWLRHVGLFALNIQMFFVLSGALITSLLVAEHQRSGTVSLKAFYLRRYRRLGPAILAILPLMVLAQLVWTGSAYRSPLGAHPLLAFGAVAAFAGNWVLFRILGGIGWLGPAWSLGVEEQFYLTWPLLLRGTLRRQLRRDAVHALLGITVIGCVGLATITYHYEGPGRTYYATFTQLPSVLIGCALGYELTANPAGRITRLLRSWIAGAVGAIGVVWVSYALAPHPGYLYRGGYVIYAAAACLLVGHCFVVAGRETALTKALSWRPLVVMGQVSYEAYLVHVIVILAVAYAAPTMAVYPMMALDSAIVAALSLSFYYLVEQPIRRHGWRQFLAGARRALPAFRAVSPQRRLAFAGGMLAGATALVVLAGFVVTGQTSVNGGAGGQPATAAAGRAAAPAVVGQAGVPSHTPTTAGSSPESVADPPAEPPAADGGARGAGTSGGTAHRPTRHPLVPPTITGLAPAIVSQAGGTTVTVTGTGFVRGVRVYIGSMRIRAIHRVSNTTLTLVSPPARLIQLKEGLTDLSVLRAPLTVRTAGGTSAAGLLSVLTFL
ncbi:MAG TPA: acyltransferase [Mycobacteriales bacterium]|nr:acyltransferase [Mycobacteriales bacterium]